MCERGGSRSASEWGAIIMPAFMLRSGPIWIVLASFGSIMPFARADDPPCPSQIEPGAPGSAPSTAPTNSAHETQGAPAGSAVTAAGATTNPLTERVSTGGNVDITSDQATLGADGKIRLSGNVHVQQAEREINADQVEYDSNNR